MIYASAQTSSERNSISPVSPFDNPKALPKSSAVLARTVLSEFDCLIEHLYVPILRHRQLIMCFNYFGSSVENKAIKPYRNAAGRLLSSQ